MNIVNETFVLLFSYCQIIKRKAKVANHSIFFFGFTNWGTSPARNVRDSDSRARAPDSSVSDRLSAVTLLR